MAKLHLTVAQRLRFRKTLKVNACRLRQLRGRPYRCVTASNAFTGESKQVEVSCVEELRKVIDTNVPFANVRTECDTPTTFAMLCVFVIPTELCFLSPGRARIQSRRCPTLGSRPRCLLNARHRLEALHWQPLAFH